MSTLDRRTLLKGFGAGVGAALFAPLIAQTRAAEAGGALPARFVFFVEGNGLWPRLFRDPKTEAVMREEGAKGKINSSREYAHDAPITMDRSSAALTPALSEAPALRALRELGLERRAAVLLGLSSKIAGGGHTSANAALSLHRALGGPSIDTLLGAAAAQSAGAAASPFEVMRVGVAGGLHTRLNYSLCTLRAGTPAPLIIDATEAFNLHFGSVARGAGMRRFTQRKQLLDFSLKEARAAERAFRGDAKSLEKLEHYRASLETMVEREAKLGAMSGGGDRLAKARDAYLTGEPSGEAASPLYKSGSFFDRLQAQTDMVTAALIGGLTQCAVVSCAAGSDWNVKYDDDLLRMFGLDSTIAAHTDLRHGAGFIGEDTSSKFVQALTEATARQVRAMGSIAAALAEVKEGDGTMLDRTALVYISDSGEKHHSAAEEWATLVIGGDKLGLKTDGRSIVYPKAGRDGHRQVSNLYNTLGHAAGLDLNDFGGESEKQRVALGPLPELYAPPTR